MTIRELVERAERFNNWPKMVWPTQTMKLWEFAWKRLLRKEIWKMRQTYRVEIPLEIKQLLWPS